MPFQSHIESAGGRLALRTRVGAAFGVASFIVLAGILAGCPSSEPPSEPPSETCRLAGTEQHTGGPDPLISSYRWDGDRLAAVTRTRLEWLAEEIQYTYDDLGRLIAEQSDQYIRNSDISHYHRKIEYEHEPSSTPGKSRPRVAKLYDSRDYQPLDLAIAATFHYSAEVLQSVSYRSYEDKDFDIRYEYNSNCISMATYEIEDGSAFFLMSEYDDHPNAGTRVFGDGFFVTPAPLSSMCDHNLARLIRQEITPTAPVKPYEITFSYTYGLNGLPSRVEYVAGDHESADFLYDCVSE
ncbi:MAG TPA: hypothetical protein VNO30_40600 [Kofleriaceae bacterium]|nr:hypothetical protein [Kofleriaceae bacterium]